MRYFKDHLTESDLIVFLKLNVGMSLMSGKMTGPERQSSISTANSPNSPSVYKIITLGNVGSGKSTLIETFIREECPDHEPAIRQTFKEQKMLLQGQRLRQVEIWDTAGKCTHHRPVIYTASTVDHKQQLLFSHCMC